MLSVRSVRSSHASTGTSAFYALLPTHWLLDGLYLESRTLEQQNL